MTATITYTGGRTLPRPPLPLAAYRHVVAAGPVPGRQIPERVVVVGCAGSGKTTLARELAARLSAQHIERDALGDDEAPGFAALVAAAVEAAGRRWVFDGTPYNAEATVYPLADTLVALDYPRRVVWRRVVARSLRLWLTRRGDGAHTSADPPWRWCAASHPVRWAVQTHAARHAEIAGLVVRPQVGHLRRYQLTSPRQAAAWLTSLHD
jgi:AAA domain